MTREEAIADIRDNIKPVVGGISLDMAIKALEACGDCISLAAAIGEISDMFNEAKKWGNEAKDGDVKARAATCMSVLIEVKLRLKALPSVEPEGKHGYWIHDDDWECSVCHSKIKQSAFPSDDWGVPGYNYCPICGADLTGV